MSIRNYSYTVGNRTRDLPACSSVPQPNCTAGCLPTSHSTKLKSPGRYLDKPQGIEPWYRQTAVSVEMPLFLRCFISGFRSSGTLRSARLLHDDVSTPNRCHIFQRLTFWCRNYFFFNFSTLCIQNVNNTRTKYVRIMKQNALWRGKKKTESIYHV